MQYWQSIVDNSIDGFFLVTFGAIAKTFEMPIKTQVVFLNFWLNYYYFFILQQKFMNAFARFPNITFIVKYEQRPNILLRLPHNVVLTEWIPQKQLMGMTFHWIVPNKMVFIRKLKIPCHSDPWRMEFSFGDDFAQEAYGSNATVCWYASFFIVFLTIKLIFINRLKIRRITCHNQKFLSNIYLIMSIKIANFIRV